GHINHRLFRNGFNPDAPDQNVGKEKQCSDYLESLKRQYQDDPQGIMRVDLFGRPIYSFVSEEIFDKAGGMKAPFRDKLRKTVAKLVNEKKSALICVTI
ncbi:MAG: hypothetical protein IKT32_06265, partial [Clostridia bacterium]|nr:hypothetical protein [Clostridia bacterium]